MNKQHILEKTKEGIVEDLIQFYDDELQTKTDKELKELYEENTGEKVKIIKVK